MPLAPRLGILQDGDVHRVSFRSLEMDKGQRAINGAGSSQSWAPGLSQKVRGWGIRARH